jgi:CrcB protein
MTWSNILMVGIGGFLGSIARFVTSRSIDSKVNSIFPYGTFAVNIIGSFIIGFIYGLAIRKAPFPESWRLLLGAGFCGGFTTFSAFAWENLNLIQGKFVTVSILYVLISLVAGFLAVMSGAWASRFLLNLF